MNQRRASSISEETILKAKKNRNEAALRASTNWQILITTFVVLVLSSFLAGCAEKSQPVIGHGGLDQCVTDPKSCNKEDLCRLAIFEEDNIKRWNKNNLRWQPYVREAQIRGLTCGL